LVILKNTVSVNRFTTLFIATAMYEDRTRMWEGGGWHKGEQETAVLWWQRLGMMGCTKKVVKMCRIEKMERVPMLIGGGGACP
jgi:hypothetical protein